jgi:hypothetical protein
MRTIILTAAAIAMCATSCGGGKAKNQNPAQTGGLTADSVTVYVPPRVPGTIVSPEAQTQWLTEHYWDDFRFADTTAVPRWSDYAEQAFVDLSYAMVNNNVPKEIADKLISTLFTKAAVNKAAFMRFGEIAENNLHHPNSPYRNEELYITVLNAMLATPVLDEWERIRPQEQLRLAMKNRVGDEAIDFRYTLANGATGTLRTLRSPYTLLFFNEPGCSSCRDMIDQIGASPFLQNLIKNGRLTVLAVYTDGDLAAWREYLPQMPENWIVSYDAPQTIKNDELYNIQAFPTIYLLDANKRVMLKDEVLLQNVEQTIYNNDTN